MQMGESTNFLKWYFSEFIRNKEWSNRYLPVDIPGSVRFVDTQSPSPVFPRRVTSTCFLSNGFSNYTPQLLVTDNHLANSSKLFSSFKVEWKLGLIRALITFTYFLSNNSSVHFQKVILNAVNGF